MLWFQGANFSEPASEPITGTNRSPQFVPSSGVKSKKRVFLTAGCGTNCGTSRSPQFVPSSGVKQSQAPMGTRRGAVPFSEPAINGIGELGGSQYKHLKPIRVEHFSLCSLLLKIGGQLDSNCKPATNIRRRKCDNLGVQKQHKPKVQRFLIELVPSLPSDLVMGFGGRWQFQMLQKCLTTWAQL